MRFRQTAICLSIALGTALLVGPPVALAQTEPPASVLELVPANAPFAVVVPNPRQLSNDLAALNATLGLGIPELNDALAMLQTITGFQDGIAEERPALLLNLDILSFDLTGVVFLVPVSDYAAFVASAGVSGDPIGSVELFPGVPGFVRSVGDYAALGFNSMVIEGLEYPPTESVAAVAGTLNSEVAAKGDALIVVNLEAAPMLRTMLAAGLSSLEQLYADMPGMEGDAGEMMRATMGLYATGLDAILRDTTIGVMGFDLDEAGIGMTGAAQFREGSNLASMFTTGGDATAVLAELPEAPILFAMATSHEGVDLDLMFAAIEAALPGTDESGGFVEVLLGGIRAMSGVSGMSAAWYAPDPTTVAAGEPSFNMVATYHTADGLAVLTALQDVFVQLDGVSFGLGPMLNAAGEMVTAEMTYSVEYEASASTIGDYRVDRFGFRTEFPAEYMDSPGMSPAMASMTGMTGYEGFMATSGGNVILTTSPDEALLAHAIAQAEGGGGLGTRVAFGALREHSLASAPSAEAFIDVGEIMRLVFSVQDPTGSMPLVEIPAGIEPLAMFGHMQDSGLAGRFWIPISVVRLLATLTM